MKARNRIGTTRLATLLLLLAASLAPGIACRTPDCEDYCDEGENYAPKGHECASYDCSEEETDTETGTETGIPEEPVASTIRLIVFYTPDAASEATAYGQDMPTLVEEYVETVNTAFEDSSILHQVELADVQETSLTQAGIVADGSLTGWDSSDVLDWLFHQLADSSSDIQSVRASSGIEADLVMVLGTTFSDVGTGGRAGGITGNTDDPDWAGAVVYWWNELGFAHELGHLFGANHDVYELEADGADTSGYNHGYVERDLGVYTIMAYDSECDFYGIACSRVAYYSNPNLLYMGHPLGEASTAFNACVIQQYGSRVANYYEFLAGTETATEVELESSCPYDMTDTSSSGCSGGTGSCQQV